MEQIRRCRVCGKDKRLTDFYPCYDKAGSIRRVCKQCFLEQGKRYHLEHREKTLDYLKKYYRENKSRAREQSRVRQKERLATDPVYKAKRQAQLSIWKAFNNNGQISSDKIKYWVGCTAEELTTHLKNTWEREYATKWNGQPYNVDHIVPLITATTVDDVKKLNHYTNLRLITPEDNFAKGLRERTLYRKNKIEKERAYGDTD
jgi:hypothetical protein